MSDTDSKIDSDVELQMIEYMIAFFASRRDCLIRGSIEFNKHTRYIGVLEKLLKMREVVEAAREVAMDYHNRETGEGDLMESLLVLCAEVRKLDEVIK